MGLGNLVLWAFPSLHCGGLLAGQFGEDGFDARNRAAQRPETGGILQLAALLLNAEIENLLLHAAAGVSEILHRLFANFFDLHGSIGRERLGVEGAADKAAADAELCSSETEGFFGKGFGNPGHFEEHVAGTNHGHPELRSAFAFTHPGFRRAGRYGLMRENANENFAFPLQVAGDRNPAGLDLVVLDPSAVQGLETKLSKGHGSPHLRIAFTAPALGLAELYSTGKHRHKLILKLNVEMDGNLFPGLPEQALRGPQEVHRHGGEDHQDRDRARD